MGFGVRSKTNRFKMK